ncbi:MAG: nucleotide exchange factor GrpE [Candidatus Pacebacteria bacterium]|nr:nucleotide exchange factor GrpE [Candidatus Paceibacterota bacterium]MCD8507957.1 nucleotide exchange factor GrpE [Candidatus Paceibacterota bacterium]MCD8527984.1 nucleotide exchange factor GrpE [Candidatus Paceibacterota bacterium]MCD8563636.1 nucleotide exchange factor GrpE [Candidatus Paceibacterota bacterium]
MSDEPTHDEYGDDIVLETDTEIEHEEHVADTVKKLREKLRAAQQEAKENLDGWQRARADYSNLQKQVAEEKTHLRKRITEDIIHDLLAPLDTFEMAMSNQESWHAVDETWRIGIEYIYGQFKNFFEEHDVRAIEPKAGDIFDPVLHESLETVPTDDETKDAVIINVLQKGYTIGDKVMRPAKVSFYTYESQK